MLDPETAAANLATSLTSPIFDTGRIRAGIEAASAIEQQAMDNYRSVVLTALAETENALIACRRSAERLATLEKATQLAHRHRSGKPRAHQPGHHRLRTLRHHR